MHVSITLNVVNNDVNSNKHRGCYARIVEEVKSEFKVKMLSGSL